MSELVEVQTGEQTVSLRPKLGLAAGIELQQKFRGLLQQEPRPSAAEITGLLTEAYLLVGVAEWTLADEMGPIPVSRENVTRYLLSDFELAQPVADKADDLYYGPVLAPLVARVSSSLRDGPTSGSTSATNGSSPKRRRRSKPSSTSTIPTDATETTTG
jgi:hypothetical protein